MLQAIRGDSRVNPAPTVANVAARLRAVATPPGKEPGVNDVRDVLATWAALEALGGRVTADVARFLGVSPPTAWRLLERLDGALARAGMALRPPPRPFTGERPVPSPVKGPPLGGRGASASGCVLRADPGRTQSEARSLRSPGLEGGGGAAWPASLTDCVNAVAAKLAQQPELTPEQRQQAVGHVGERWEKIEACKGDRVPYAVAVAFNFCRERGWLAPRTT